MKFTITASISTKDRYFTSLPSTLCAIATQTVRPQRLLIFDDGEHKDLRTIPMYDNIFRVLQNNGISWEVVFGERKGQVLNHQKTINMSTTDLIWRVDDDDLPEPNTLEILTKAIEPDDVAAVSGRVWFPASPGMKKEICSSKIEDLYHKSNLQWSNVTEVTEVDHFNNTFLYKRALATHGYCMDLSPVGHGEETLFTYGFRKAGYKLILDPKALIWHMREPTGGIRAFTDTNMWGHDSEITLGLLKKAGVEFTKYKLCVLENGLGDHICFKMILPELIEKYKDHKIQLAVCYPYLFQEYKDIEILSIEDAKLMGANLDQHNVYKWMWDRNWSTSFVDAFRGMFL